MCWRFRSTELDQAREMMKFIPYHQLETRNLSRPRFVDRCLVDKSRYPIRSKRSALAIRSRHACVRTVALKTKHNPREQLRRALSNLNISMGAVCPLSGTSSRGAEAYPKPHFAPRHGRAASFSSKPSSDAILFQVSLQLGGTVC